MGFSDLPTISRAQDYLDTAFSRARENARKYTLADHEKSALNREKSLSLVKISTINDYLTSKFEVLIQKYPDFDSLSEFYVQLLKATVSYATLKKSLGALQWCVRRVQSVSKQSMRQVKTATSAAHVGQHLNQYYGRVSSLMKQIDAELTYLHEARQIMRTYPSIKDEFSVAIAGFPNVGKSTLLAKLTSASPEVNNYAFTTKTLNVGYREIHAINFQFIDTPGTLAREEKMNTVEMQATLALKYCASIIIYVFDTTENCGYSLTDQLKLFKQLKKLGKPLCAYLAKQDLITEGDIDAFRDKHFEKKTIPLLLSIPDLEKFCLKQYREEYR